MCLRFKKKSVLKLLERSVYTASLSSLIRDVADSDGSYDTSLSSLTRHLVELDHYHTEALNNTDRYLGLPKPP
jgi:hypothetical protein